MSDSNAHSADLSALKIDRGNKSKPPGRWKRWFHLLWILVPVIMYFGYQVGMKKIAPSLSVRTAVVTMMTGSGSTAELVATGYVVAQVKAEVASKATGRLDVLNVEEGDRVKKSDILAELDNSDIEAQLEIANANVKLARADSIASDLNYKRQQTLLDSGYTTAQVMEGATATYHKALANLEAMKAGVKAVEVDLDNTIIRAPFDGTVLTKNADVGEMVAPFASASSSKGAVVTIADMSSLEVEADVSESNIQKVIVGNPCEIILDAYPDVTYKGYVNKIIPTADRARATVKVKIGFDNLDSRVLPEMSARVNFLPGKAAAKEEIKPVKIIPHNAITTRDDQKVVFVVEGEYVRQVPITIGRRLGDDTEIISGLDVGQEVVLSPAGGLKSSDKIAVSQ